MNEGGVSFIYSVYDSRDHRYYTVINKFTYNTCVLQEPIEQNNDGPSGARLWTLAL